PRRWIILGGVLVGATAVVVALAILLLHLNDPERLTRKWSAQLGDGVAAKRLEAARALGDMGADARGAVPSLEEALEDPDTDVRRAAAGALWKVDRQAGPVLAILWRERSSTFSAT